MLDPKQTIPDPAPDINSGSGFITLHNMVRGPTGDFVPVASFPAWRVAPPAGGRTGSPAVIINKGHYLLYQNIENIQTSTRISVRQDDLIMFIIRQDTVLNVNVYRRLDTGNG